jgi:hypothetical protein
MTTDDDQGVVSVYTAMRLLNESRSTIHRRLRAGKLAGFNAGGRRKITLASIRKCRAERPEDVSYRKARQLLREAEARTGATS